MARVITEVPLPLDADEILDFAAVPLHPATWMMVARDGALFVFDAERSSRTNAGRITIYDEPDHEPWVGHELAPRLHVAADGRSVAVVNDYGKLGCVYDSVNHTTIKNLDGGVHNFPETVPFPFCFTQHRGQSLAIHRTDWNRLDVFDLASRRLLTERGPTRYSKGEPEPDHYLSYFHGRLLPSPGGARIADDGWVWHPVGIPEVWDIAPWVETNPWESEDGPSKLTLCCRAYCWDNAMCWLDEDRIAVGGIGEDEDDMIAGARVFAVKEPVDWETENYFGHGAREVATFEGPAGQFFGDGSRLFSADDSGLRIWDVDEQEQIDEIVGFVPTRQHPGSRELVQLSGSTLRRWKY